MPLTHVALALTIALLWGVNFVVMKHVVSEVPPFAVTGLRFLLASLPLVFFVPRPQVTMRGLIGFGLAFGVVKFGLLFTAFKIGMPAGLASLVLQMQVVFTILLAFVALGERPRPLQWAGVAVALAGVLAIVAGRLEGAALLPVLMTVAAAFFWGVANIILKREGRFDALGFAVWSSLFPGIAMTLLALLIEGPATIVTAVTQMTWTGIGALAYLVYPISIVSGSMWAFLMGRHSAATVAPFALLVPVIGLVCGWYVYGEALTPSTIVGGLLIVAGIVLNLLPAQKAMRATAARTE
jgi:O-acetylserine/cysteine efflux transporter